VSAHTIAIRRDDKLAAPTERETKPVSTCQEILGTYQVLCM
jgi:hypothetical protein